MIRNATYSDYQIILDIYARARNFMRLNGNPYQWGDNSPAPNLLLEDVQKKRLYVLEEDNTIHCVFALISGEDPTYHYIEGSWRNDAPYAAIHRVASAGIRSGVLLDCLDFCKSRHPNLRIDTHHDNVIMQHLLEKYQFHRCGTIYLENGDPRIAYQWP